MGRTMSILWCLFAALLLAGPVLAQEEAKEATATEAPKAAEKADAAPTVDDLVGADTAFMLVASALVLLMTPGLAFFYGGLVRRKNVLSVLMQCFMCMCLMTVLWVVVGYSLAFGESMGGFMGDPSTYFMFQNVGEAPQKADHTIPHVLFATFQGMFAIITPALILGAFAERMKFSGFCAFSSLWLLLCYTPVCHWAWGGGYFDGAEAATLLMAKGQGAIDFAGGTVVHINAGIAALAAAFILGKRQGYPEKISPPHNLPFAVLGAGMLWFGWFGFNAGSELAADGTAAMAFFVTNLCAATAGLTWAVIEWFRNGKPTVLGIISGAVAGLVAITPACGNVNAVGALILGVGASLLAYIAVAVIKEKFGYDDSLDVWGIHGMAGMWGAIAVGFLTVEGAGGEQVWVQIKSVLATVVYTGVVSFVLYKIVDATIGLKATEHEERVGMDLTDHAEHAYTMID
ncbi:MAG: ammonium transporter [Phycisphaeraceae bacterium]|nr:ammonium transporter [Phycisphaeraceae bacterium]